MAFVELAAVSAVPVPVVSAATSTVVPPQALHRIQQVRRQQGVSLRSAARDTGMRVPRLRAQEDPSTDLRLSDLYRWQQALDVPVSELLEEPGMELSKGIHERAQMIRLMKTAAALLEAAESDSTRQCAQEIVNELIALMPELKEVGAWHTVGQRRGLNEMGRIMENMFSTDNLAT